MASADWLANVSSSSITSGGKLPVPRRRITSTPIISSPRSIGTASTERQPSRNRMSRNGSSSTVRKVGNLERLVGERGPTHQGRFPVDRDRPQLLQQRGTAAERAADVERVARLVVLQDRSAVGAQGDVAEAEVGQPHRVADDAFEDLVEVEARADRLVHLAERLELRDLVRQLGASWTPARASGRPGATRSRPARRTPRGVRARDRRRVRRRCATSTARRRPRPAGSSAWTAACGSR